jgi:hypothetical protein
MAHRQVSRCGPLTPQQRAPSRLHIVTPEDRFICSPLEGGSLAAQMGGQTFRLIPTGEGAFRAANVQNLNVSFDGRGGMIESVTVGQVSSTVTLARVAADIVGAAPARTPPAAARPAASSASSAPPPRAAARNWPSFRGESASGNGDGQRAVAEWDTATGKNIKWKTPIPGRVTSHRPPGLNARWSRAQR